MAKRGVPEHPKTLKLARRLGIEPWAAVGLLEVFWHWCSRYAITGLITAAPEDVADGMRYRGDADEMFAALVASGWVDATDSGQFVVHDVEQHADNTWKANLKRVGKEFFTSSPSSHESVTIESQPNHERVTTKSQLSCEPPKPEPEPEPLPEPKPSGRGVGETKLRSILLEVPAFAKAPPAAGKLDELIEDFSELGEAAILRHAKAARDWALGPKTRYAKAPNTPADSVKFLRNWLEKELKSARNGLPDQPPEPASKGWNPSEEELAEIHR